MSVHSISALKIQVIRARNLAPKDSNGLSDPFVVVKLQNKKKTTKVIPKTLEPTWDTTFEFKINMRNPPKFIQVVCWDNDFFGRDFMGQLNLSFRELFIDGVPLSFDPSQKRTIWYTLEKKSSKDVISGEIELNMGFILTSSSNRSEDWVPVYESLVGKAPSFTSTPSSLTLDNFDDLSSESDSDYDEPNQLPSPQPSPNPSKQPSQAYPPQRLYKQGYPPNQSLYPPRQATYPPRSPSPGGYAPNRVHTQPTPGMI
ncbi:phosphatidylserine decarboxylase [Basidiobolus ranarum]|uniref:Phosphatidylserine decarboxylase n=1 Tax=Basidiobolus ranarum TaxID=34480 RepID=A0ABR2WAX3_9FUNG